MAVVAAGVHFAGDGGRVRDAGLLEDVQRIEVRAQADRVLPGSAAQGADDARLREPRVHVESERAQLVGDKGAGLRLFERGFGMRVNVMAPRLHVRNELLDLGVDVHGQSLAC